MEEIRNLPESQVSFVKNVARNFLSRHTGIGEDRPEIQLAVKVDLTRHIASTIDDLQEEIRYSFDKELGECKDWSAVTLYPATARIISLLSGRVFVGRPLSRTQEWIDASVNFTVDAAHTRYAIGKWPPFLRPIVAPFLPEIRGLKKYAKRGAELLDPILQKTLAKARNEKTGGYDDDGFDEQGTFVSWVLKHTPKGSREDAYNLARAQMSCKFVHSPLTTCT